jgi:hypothetical protein
MAAAAAPSDINSIIKEWRRLSTRAKLSIVNGTSYFYNVTFGLDACEELFKYIEGVKNDLIGWVVDYHLANRKHIWQRIGLEGGWNSVHKCDELPPDFETCWQPFWQPYLAARTAMDEYRRRSAEPCDDPEILAIHAGNECEGDMCWWCDEIDNAWKRMLYMQLNEQNPHNIFIDYFALTTIYDNDVGPSSDVFVTPVWSEPTYDTLDESRKVYGERTGKTKVQLFIPLVENVTCSSLGASIFGIDVRTPWAQRELTDHEIYNLLCKKLLAVLYTIEKDRAQIEYIRSI